MNEQQERKIFEAWRRRTAKTANPDTAVALNGFGDDAQYDVPATRAMWTAWQARASLPSNPEHDTYGAPPVGALTAEEAQDLVARHQKAAYEVDADSDAYEELIAARKALLAALAAAPAPADLPRSHWQKRAVELGFTYWRGSDAHGVSGTPEKAILLLEEVLGVEVEVEPTSASFPLSTAEEYRAELHEGGCYDETCPGCAEVVDPADVANAPVGFTNHEKSAWSIGYQEGSRNFISQSSDLGELVNASGYWERAEPGEAVIDYIKRAVSASPTPAPSEAVKGVSTAEPIAFRNGASVLATPPEPAVAVQAEPDDLLEAAKAALKAMEAVDGMELPEGWNVCIEKDIRDLREAMAAHPKPAAPATADEAQWIAEARLTLDRLGAFLQAIEAPHAVDWREWIDNAEKHVLALRSGASAQPAADMFWDHDDGEQFGHSIDEIINGGFGPGDVVKIDRALRLPSIKVIVVKDPASDDYLTYEEIAPKAKEQPHDR